MKYTYKTFVSCLLILNFFNTLSPSWADGIIQGVPYVGTAPSSPGDYNGAPNPPTQSSGIENAILGKCTVYQDPLDTMGYPCPKITIQLLDDNNHLVKSAQIDTSGRFTIVVKPNKTYKVRIKDTKYVLRKDFNPAIRAGEVLLPLERVK